MWRVSAGLRLTSSALQFRGKPLNSFYGGRLGTPVQNPILWPSSRAFLSSFRTGHDTPNGGDAPKGLTVFHRLAANYAKLSSAYGQLAKTRYGRLMRLDKPIGTHLLFLPTAWGISMGATSMTDAFFLYGLTYSGAVVMRGAGCTVNDLLDEDLDRKVERTRLRPIATGEISRNSAVAFLAAQMTAGLGVLLSLNNYAIAVGTPSVIPVMLYPLCKRLTNYPQAVLGLTINWGALVGYAAASDSLGPSAFCLYGAGWCWTMIYDTIYAHQDKKDDVLVGVKSSALALGSRTKPVLAGLCAAKLGFLTAAGLFSGLSTPFYAGVAVTGAHMARQIAVTDLDNADSCLRAFISNSTAGAITWFAILAGRVL